MRMFRVVATHYWSAVADVLLATFTDDVFEPQCVNNTNEFYEQVMGGTGR